MPGGRAKGSPKVPGSGRKPRYTSAEEMNEKIEVYFTACQGTVLKDPETGQLIMDKFGRPIIVDAEPPTVTGLALALGFSCRGDLLMYQGKKEFNEIITRAKSRVEAYTESRLFDRDGANGARFSLSCNFKWGEEKKPDSEGGGPVVKIICDIPRAKVEDRQQATQPGAPPDEVSDDAASS